MESKNDYVPVPQFCGLYPGRDTPEQAERRWKHALESEILLTLGSLLHKRKKRKEPDYVFMDMSPFLSGKVPFEDCRKHEVGMVISRSINLVQYRYKYAIEANECEGTYKEDLILNHFRDNVESIIAQVLKEIKEYSPNKNIKIKISDNVILSTEDYCPPKEPRVPLEEKSAPSR